MKIIIVGLMDFENLYRIQDIFPRKLMIRGGKAMIFLSQLPGKEHTGGKTGTGRGSQWLGPPLVGVVYKRQQSHHGQPHVGCSLRQQTNELVIMCIFSPPGSSAFCFKLFLYSSDTSYPF